MTLPIDSVAAHAATGDEPDRTHHTPPGERRAHPRIMIDCPLSVLRDGQVIASLTAIDLSTGGMQAMGTDRCMEQLLPDGQYPPAADASALDFEATLSEEYGAEHLHGRLTLAWIRTLSDDRVLLGLAFAELGPGCADLLERLAEAATEDAWEALELLTRPSSTAV